MRYYENNEVDEIKFIVTIGNPITIEYEFNNLNDAVGFFQTLVFASIDDPSGIKLTCIVERKII